MEKYFSFESTKELFLNKSKTRALKSKVKHQNLENVKINFVLTAKDHCVSVEFDKETYIKILKAKKKIFKSLQSGKRESTIINEQSIKICIKNMHGTRGVSFENDRNEQVRILAETFKNFVALKNIITKEYNALSNNVRTRAQNLMMMTRRELENPKYAEKRNILKSIMKKLKKIALSFPPVKF